MLRVRGWWWEIFLWCEVVGVAGRPVGDAFESDWFGEAGTGSGRQAYFGKALRKEIFLLL